MRPAAGLRGLSLARRGVAIEIAVGLPFGESSIQDVLDMLHNEVDGHCGTGTRGVRDAPGRAGRPRTAACPRGEGTWGPGAKHLSG